jgi:hypothetical protein
MWADKRNDDYASLKIITNNTTFEILTSPNRVVHSQKVHCLFSKEPTTIRYPEPDESSPQIPMSVPYI